MNEPTLTVCPDCGLTGPEVYRAESHPLSCKWMMNNMHRCGPHDELLRPDEETCPFPDEPEDADDAHHRLVSR